MRKLNIVQLAALVVSMLLVKTLQAVEFTDYDFSRFSQQVTDCDRLAAHNRDPGHVSPGVKSESMNKSAAIKACTEAVQADPDNPRLNYQLGRAYGYSGQGDQAMPYRLKAIEQDYPQSLFVIGYLYFNGQTIEQDTCKAMALWLRAARYRRLAALVALPRTYMRGGFSSCEVKISEQDIKAYLVEAKSISDDFYTNMLIEDLLIEFESR